MMVRTTYAAAALAFGLLAGLACPVRAQDIPDDMTPYVSLGADMLVQVYQDPVVRDGRIVSLGTLTEERRIRQKRIGSGTVITSSGLILTNFHVYDAETVIPDLENNRVLVARRLANEMLVYRLNGNDPLQQPELAYYAIPVCLDSERDVALLHVTGDASSGAAVADLEISRTPFGNPYDIGIQEELTLVGYPGSGGFNLTVTIGSFLNYANGIAEALDGSIVTDGAIGGGSSGGAALYDGHLVGMPTRGSGPARKGSSYGYIHPVSWAVNCLAQARLRYGVDVPSIDRDWVMSEYNPDEAADRIYVGGTITSGNSSEPVEDALVFVHRSDWTLERALELQEQVSGARMIYQIQQLGRQGWTARQIAQEYPELGLDRIDRILATEFDIARLPETVQRYLAGEFFYAFEHSRPDGFFMVPLPRGVQAELIVVDDRFRPFTRTVTTGDGLYQQLGTLPLYQRPF